MAKSILKEFTKNTDLKKVSFQNQIENIYYKKIRPAKKNRGLRRIDELAADIADAGLENSITVRKIEDGEYEYEIIAGERRFTAICMNIQNGDMTYEYIPAKVENMNELQARKRLILNNYQNDPLTVAEKLDAIEELKEILKEEQKQGLVSGRLQEIIANELGMKKSQVGNYEKVINNAVPEVREKIADGTLTLKAATELVDMDDEDQLMFIQDNDDLSITSVREHKEKQMAYQTDDEIVPPSGTSFNDINEEFEDEVEEIKNISVPATPVNKKGIKECMLEIDGCYEILLERVTGVEWKEEVPALETAVAAFNDLKMKLGIGE